MVTPVSDVVSSAESTVLCACVGGAPRVLLAEVLFWSRSVPRPRVAPMLAEGPAIEVVQGVGSTASRTVQGTSAQGIAGSHMTGAVPGMAVLWPELADGTPVTPAVWNGGLTLTDSALCGGVVGIECFRQSGG